MIRGGMAGIWFLAVILVGFEINRKTGGISLTIAFGATRKNAFIGYIISDIAMIAIFSGFQMLIAAYTGEKKYSSLYFYYNYMCSNRTGNRREYE